MSGGTYPHGRLVSLQVDGHAAGTTKLILCNYVCHRKLLSERERFSASF